MQVISTIEEMQHWTEAATEAGRTVGFVPTMGALHRGHAELVAHSIADNDATVLSIFVNPTQFNDPDDFDRYPRTWDDDLVVAKRAGVDVVFAPSVGQMYPPGFATTIRPGPVADLMEGRQRPGHFEGVATVVVRLLNIVGARRAYFGEKDFQQLAVVRAVVTDLAIDTLIVGVATVRDHDGLALSSRNSRLTEPDRAAAAIIPRALAAGRDAHLAGHRVAEVRRVVRAELDSEQRCRTDYVEVVDALTLVPLPEDGTAQGLGGASTAVVCVAAWFGGIRLIDNMTLS